MRFTEEQLKRYALPLSDYEKNMCENAIRMVKDALEDLGFESRGDIDVLNESTYAYRVKMRNISSSYDVTIFVKGSYANNTNVRQNSDVDIAIVREDIFYDEYREGVTRDQYNFFATYEPPTQFKDEVEDALIKKFGSMEVQRGNIAICVNGNTYRKDADCVPCFRFRNYKNDKFFDTNNYIGGIKIISDKGKVIINYPEQHINNGVIKNKKTNYMYKKMVRIIKEMRYQLIEIGNENAKKTSSYGVEGLLWNIPDKYFTKYKVYGFIFDDLIIYLNSQIDQLITFKEPNDILYMFDTDEKLLIYKRFIEDLKNYYKYYYEE